MTVIPGQDIILVMVTKMYTKEFNKITCFTKMWNYGKHRDASLLLMLLVNLAVIPEFLEAFFFLMFT